VKCNNLCTFVLQEPKLIRLMNICKFCFQPDCSFINVADISKERIFQLEQQVLTSKEVVVSLVYRDHSTQLRDELFGQERKVMLS